MSAFFICVKIKQTTKENIMSTYLYHSVNGKPKQVLVEASEVEGLLKSGYAISEDALKPKKKAKKAKAKEE